MATATGMTPNQAWYSVPYRDTGHREQTVANAIQLVTASYLNSKLSQPVRVRPLYYYDLQNNSVGTSVYNNSNEVTLSSLSTPVDGFTYDATQQFTVPNNKAFIFYGISDLAANPVLQAWKLTIENTVYPDLYLAPEILADQDKRYIYPTTFRALPPNTTATIVFYGSGAGPDNIDMLGFVAELGSAPEQ